MKTSSSKNRDANISAVHETSWLFSHEKPKFGNKSDEDREEMSTTINYTFTNNDASIFHEDFQQRLQLKPSSPN